MREDKLALLVFLIFNVDFNGVADLQVGVVAEFADGDDAVALVANVDHYFALVHGNDSAVHHLVFTDFVEGFVVGLCKFFLAYARYGATFLKRLPVEVLQRLYIFKV